MGFFFNAVPPDLARIFQGYIAIGASWKVFVELFQNLIEFNKYFWKIFYGCIALENSSKIGGVPLPNFK